LGEFESRLGKSLHTIGKLFSIFLIGIHIMQRRDRYFSDDCNKNNILKCFLIKRESNFISR
jgi:hypothetical protein